MFYTALGFLSVRVYTGEQSHYGMCYRNGTSHSCGRRDLKVHSGTTGGREESLIIRLRSQARYPGLSRWAQVDSKCPSKRETERNVPTVIGNVVTIGVMLRRGQEPRNAEARKGKNTDSPLKPQKEPVLRMPWLELSETNFGHLASTIARE